MNDFIELAKLIHWGTLAVGILIGFASVVVIAAALPDFASADDYEELAAEARRKHEQPSENQVITRY